MAFEFIDMRVRFADGSEDDLPEILDGYVDALSLIAPSKAYQLGDPEYDWNTLNATAGTRDELVRLREAALSERPGYYDSVTIDWDHPDFHELSSTGDSWVKSTGIGLRYELEVDDVHSPERMKMYLSIRFGRLVTS